MKMSGPLPGVALAVVSQKSQSPPRDVRPNAKPRSSTAPWKEALQACQGAHALGTNCASGLPEDAWQGAHDFPEAAQHLAERARQRAHDLPHGALHGVQDRPEGSWKGDQPVSRALHGWARIECGLLSLEHRVPRCEDCMACLSGWDSPRFSGLPCGFEVLDPEALTMSA